MRGKRHDLGVRTLINGTCALLIAFLIFLAHHPAIGWIFAAAVAVIGVIAVWEYDQILLKKGVVPAVQLSIIVLFFYPLLLFLKTLHHFEGENLLFYHFRILAPQILLGSSVLACFVFYALRGLPPIINMSATLFGIFYIAIPLGCLLQVMYFFGPKGNSIAESWWIVYLLAVTKSADIGGYFVGSFFGKRKLAHKLSPNKTLEGAIGGLGASLLVSIVIGFSGYIWGGVFERFFWFQVIGLGILLGLLGQIGDLAESFLKRDANVKDSNAIPGVGGVLDMIDSLLFTAPVVYIFLRIAYT